MGPADNGAKTITARAAIIATSVAFALTITGAAHGQPLDKQKMAEFDAANQTRLKCFSTWMRTLAASGDPVEHVADAVISRCEKEITEFRARARAALTSLSSQDISKSLEGQRKTVISGLVLLRLERKQQATGGLPQPQEPQTREGKLADCDIKDAEWRKWVAERGHVRWDMSEEHENNMAECRAEANKAPSAFDFHARK